MLFSCSTCGNYILGDARVTRTFDAERGVELVRYGCPTCIEADGEPLLADTDDDARPVPVAV